VSPPANDVSNIRTCFRGLLLCGIFAADCLHRLRPAIARRGGDRTSVLFLRRGKGASGILSMRGPPGRKPQQGILQYYIGKLFQVCAQPVDILLVLLLLPSHVGEFRAHSGSRPSPLSAGCIARDSSDPLIARRQNRLLPVRFGAPPSWTGADRSHRRLAAVLHLGERASSETANWRLRPSSATSSLRSAVQVSTDPLLSCSARCRDPLLLTLLDAGAVIPNKSWRISTRSATIFRICS